MTRLDYTVTPVKTEQGNATEPTAPVGWPKRAILSPMAEKLLMGIVVAVALFLLGPLSPFAHLADPGDQAGYGPGGGIIVRSEVRRLWLPESLIALAHRCLRFAPETDHVELRRFLEDEHLEAVWYATTVRGHQANGESAEVTFIRRPYTDSDNGMELLEALATAAGRPPRNPVKDFSNASIHVVSEKISRGNPRAVLSDEEFRFDAPTLPAGAP